MIKTYQATISIAASVINKNKDPIEAICYYLENLGGLGIHVDSIQLNPSDQEIPSSVNQEDFIKLTKHNTV